MPRQSARNKATAAPVKLEQEIEKKADTKSKNGPVKTEETVEEKVTTKGKNRTAKSKATVTKTTVTKKRKAADDEDHECDSCDEKEEEKPKPAAKKQRTKKAKEEDNMPLAERTAVTSLKRGMYIGAHVSGAGGQFAQANGSIFPPFLFLFLQHQCLLTFSLSLRRRPTFDPKRPQHRSQLLRSVPQVPEKMGEPTPGR